MRHCKSSLPFYLLCSVQFASLLATAQDATNGALLFPRYGPSAVTDGEWVYVYGGAPHGGRNGDDFMHQGLHASIERVDPISLTSTYFSSGLHRRANHASVLVENQIISCGGRSQVGLSRPKMRACEYLDLGTGVFREMPPLPQPVRTPGMVEVNEDLYVVGGVLDGPKYSSSIFRLTKSGKAWEYVSDAPFAVSGMAISIANEIYVLGGFNGEAMRSVMVFDTEQMEWRTNKELPYPLSAYSAITDGSSIFIFGDYNQMDAIHRYDLKTGNLFKIERKMTPRRHTAAVAVGDRILIIGGNQTSSSEALSLIEAFNFSDLKKANEVLVSKD